MDTSDRLGLVLALPGVALAAVIFALLVFSKTVCDPLYEPNRLLETEFQREISHALKRDLGGPFEPPPRPGLRLTRDLRFPASCYRTQ